MQNLDTPLLKMHILYARNHPIVLFTDGNRCTLRSDVETRSLKGERKATLEAEFSAARFSNLGKRLDPALKSWLDNVIIPALVREYLGELEKRNRLAMTGPSEVTSDKDGDQS